MNNPATESKHTPAEQDFGFNAGTIAALAVLTSFDQETIWCEVLRAAGIQKVMEHALREEGDWQWAGLEKYAARNFPKEVRAARAALHQSTGGADHG